MKTLVILFWDYLAGKGVERASEELFNERIDICRSNSCGSYKRPCGIKAIEKCGECGCFLNAKARIKEWYVECPKGLW